MNDHGVDVRTKQQPSQQSRSGLRSATGEKPPTTTTEKDDRRRSSSAGRARRSLGEQSLLGFADDAADCEVRLETKRQESLRLHFPC